jgi:hypothetical protein
MWDNVLLSTMKKAASKRKLRNGRAYLGVWIDPEVIDKAKEEAKKDKRTLAAYVEMGLSNHNDFWTRNQK